MALTLQVSEPVTVGQYVNVLAKGGQITGVAHETRQQQEDRAQQEALLAQWDAQRAAVQEEHRQALEEAKRTGWIRLDDGEVYAYHGVTPDGIECHHRHRTQQAAIECTRKRMS